MRADGVSSAVKADGWIERVTHLNQWRRGGERAPHKPLLLLYALGRLQRTGSASVAFVDAEPDLKRLLEEFGPPRPPHPEYPFHHLTSDGLWVVETPSGKGSPGASLRALRLGAIGALDSDFATALERDPALFAGVVHALLDANFPATMHSDILEAVGIELEIVEAPHVPKTRRRDPAFRDLVLLAYEYRCAFCGYDGQLMREAVGIEAAHVRWWAAAGPDDLSNGVALCSLHHKLFDRGALGISPNRTATVSSHFITRSTSGEQAVLA
jgi:putative restriction endonuclease